MQNSNVPAKFAMPFAKNAGGSYTRTIPAASQIGITAGAASLNDGFPPLNFQSVGSGGVPPFGQDMNGILNQATAWNQWQQAGGTVRYDATFSTQIGGYPFGAVLQSTTSGLLWYNTLDNNTTNPDAGGAVGWLPFGPATTYVPLLASATYYVSTSGNDSNNGLTSGTAFATLQKANNVIAGFNLNNHNVTVNVAAGSYAPVNLTAINGNGSVNFVGNSGTPSSVTIAGVTGSAINAGSVGTGYSFNGFTLTSAGFSGADSGAALNANGNSSITLQNIVFGACQGGHIVATNFASVTLGGTLTISGGLTANALLNGVHIYCGGSAFVTTIGWATGTSRPALTVSGAVAIPYFIACASNALVEVLYASITNPGNVTGTKYSIALNGVVNTAGQATSYYPGTIAGSTSTGGQYA